MIMESMLILTLQTSTTNMTQSNPARMNTTTQMFSTMAACERTKQRLIALYDRRSGVVREYYATVNCVSTE